MGALKSGKKKSLKSQQKNLAESQKKNSLVSEQKVHNNFFMPIIFILCSVMLLMCLRSSYTTSFFPVYADEITQMLLASRIGYDFPFKVSQLPMCSSFINPISYSVLWYVPGFIEWLMHGHIFDLKVFRFVGVITSWFIFLLLAFQLCYQNREFFNSRYKKIILFFFVLASILSLMEIGVVPFSLVALRPEQSILLFLVILLFIFSVSPQTQFRKIVLTLIYFICVSMLFYLHAKTLFLFPALILIGGKIFSHFKNKYIFTALFFLLCFLVVKNYAIWMNDVYNCSNSPSIQETLKGFNVDVHNIVQKPALFFSEIWDNFSSYSVDIKRISFQVIPEGAYLPSIEVGNGLTFFNKLLFINYTLFYIFLFFATMISCARDLCYKEYLTNNVLAFVLFLCTTISLFLNKGKHWYDGGYLWSLLVLIFFFYISAFVPYLLSSSKRRITYLVMGYFLAVGIVSQFFFIHAFDSVLTNEADAYKYESLSLSRYNYKELNEQLDKLSLLCGIDKNKSNHLILDDLTYLHFQRSKNPLLYTYLFYGLDRPFLHRFSSKLQVEGMVVRVNFIPEPFRAKYGLQIGNLICVPKKNIQPLFEEMYQHFGI